MLLITHNNFKMLFPGFYGKVMLAFIFHLSFVSDSLEMILLK